MKLQVKTRKILEASNNYSATIVDNKVIPVDRLPNPSWLEISEEDGAYFLYYLDANLKCFTDTWHETLESAKREAMLGFGVELDEWTETAC